MDGRGVDEAIDGAIKALGCLCLVAGITLGAVLTLLIVWLVR